MIPARTQSGSDDNVKTVVFPTRMGTFAVSATGRAVTGLCFPCQVPNGLASDSRPCALLRQAKKEVEEYFDGKRTAFTLPLEPSGSEFMRAVWKKLLGIEFGQTMTYGQIARALGKPGASRAVGMACRCNPIPLLIPCHRVVGTGGKLTGFSGGGVEMKQQLLQLEAQVRLAIHAEDAATIQ